MCLYANNTGCGGHYLEEMEPHLHLAGLLQLLPTVEDMAARLRPKMLQDPLLDAEGRPYSYFRICRYDGFKIRTTIKKRVDNLSLN